MHQTRAPNTRPMPDPDDSRGDRIAMRKTVETAAVITAIILIAAAIILGILKEILAYEKWRPRHRKNRHT